MNIFKLLGTIAVDNSDANKAIDDTTGKAEHSEGRMSSALKKIGAAVVAAFATDKILDFGKACVDATATVAAEQSSFEQIMGDYSDTAKEKVAEIAEATGMVDTRLTPYMTSMTAKFKGLGYDIGDSTDYAQQGLTIAADAAAFWDKSLDDSMSALNSFVNGSYEGGEAIGLFANDTQMAAYAVKKGLVAETKEWANLDEATKQATRLEYAENMLKKYGTQDPAVLERCDLNMDGVVNANDTTLFNRGLAYATDTSIAAFRAYADNHFNLTRWSFGVVDFGHKVVDVTFTMPSLTTVWSLHLDGVFYKNEEVLKDMTIPLSGRHAVGISSTVSGELTITFPHTSL